MTSQNINYVYYEGDWTVSISKNFIHNKKISKDARFLFIFLKSYSSPSSPMPFPDSETVAEILGVSINTYYKYFKELKDSGFARTIQEKEDNGHFGRRYISISETPFTKNCETDSPNRLPKIGERHNKDYNIYTNNYKRTVEKSDDSLPDLFPELPRTEKELKEKRENYQSYVDFWNAINKANVRLTKKKARQINARRRTFSKDEIFRGIKNRAEVDFFKSVEGEKFLGNWDSYFRSDDRIEKYAILKEKEKKQEPKKSKVLKFTDED